MSVIAGLALAAIAAYVGLLTGVWIGAMAWRTCNALNRLSEPPARKPEWRAKP
jgi:ABC-type microcin C transport system permease subunit YejE